MGSLRLDAMVAVTGKRIPFNSEVLLSNRKRNIQQGFWGSEKAEGRKKKETGD
jgi:hypothetical protein